MKVHFIGAPNIVVGVKCMMGLIKGKTMSLKVHKIYIDPVRLWIRRKLYKNQQKRLK
jgi:hypothetical protein